MIVAYKSWACDVGGTKMRLQEGNILHGPDNRVNRNELSHLFEPTVASQTSNQFCPMTHDFRRGNSSHAAAEKASSLPG
jgi:hypothetical protein